MTSFIGREQELAEVRDLLRQTRLLTLTGAGGVGKTRLAHEAATSLLDQSASASSVPSVASEQSFPDGIWLVELASLADPSLVPQAVAAVLGVREEPGRLLTSTLAADLQSTQLLLILDNCEHLVEACAEVADALLRACQELRILATSRQPLRIAGETTLRVPSLALSAAEQREVSPASEAVLLFVERAQAVMPGFMLTDDNRPAVEQICRRLDGIPLAIELAAARIEVLSPEQIAARLGDRFRLLSGGSRTALPRHQTLRALVDWSHDLLDERERTLLRRLAVFAGSWTLDAAEAVAGFEFQDLGARPREHRPPDDVVADIPAAERLDFGDSEAAHASTDTQHPTPNTLDLLAALVAKSLVLPCPGADEVRYRFLESLREYAAEKLRAADEEATLRERHCAWLLTLAERAEREFNGPDAVQWLNRLEDERENVRAALRWCLEHGQAEPGLRLAGTLTQFWLVRGPYQEIRAMLAELLRMPAALERSTPIRSARARALLAAGRLAMRQDDRGMATVHFLEALEISQELDDRRSLGIARFSIGHVFRVQGEYSTARGHHAEAIRVFETLGDDHWLANIHHDLGLAAYFEGDLESARQHYDATLALSERLGDEHSVASALNDLGELALLRGELAEARSLEGASLAIARRVDDKKLIAMAFGALAGIAVAQGRPTRALRLAAAATELNAVTRQRHSPAWHAMLERWLEPAHQAMNAEACAAAEAAGRAMSLDEAIEYALGPDQLFESTPVSAASVAATESSSRAATCASAQRGTLAPPGPSHELTPRELEVAALVARGLSNRQIADELVIAKGTAANHVKHILARLGVESRVQIAAWAVEHGLLGRVVS